MTAMIKKGDTVWVVNRELVRKGRGPLQHVVGEVLSTAGVPWGWQPRGTRGCYTLRETHTSQIIALNTYLDMANSVLHEEVRRHAAIRKRIEHGMTLATKTIPETK